jgi:hypothetical protein
MDRTVSSDHALVSPLTFACVHKGVTVPFIEVPMAVAGLWVSENQHIRRHP